MHVSKTGHMYMTWPPDYFPYLAGPGGDKIRMTWLLENLPKGNKCEKSYLEETYGSY